MKTRTSTKTSMYFSSHMFFSAPKLIEAQVMQEKMLREQTEELDYEYHEMRPDVDLSKTNKSKDKDKDEECSWVSRIFCCGK